jgi:hypothetical protein
VKWTEDTFATGGSKGDLLKVLEECIVRRVMKQDRYKNDPRCLKLWVTYVSLNLALPRTSIGVTCELPQANLLPDPHDVFVYLKVRAVVNPPIVTRRILTTIPLEQAHQIGCDLAMFWTAYAWYHEKKGNFQAAANLYTKGINRYVDLLLWCPTWSSNPRHLRQESIAASASGGRLPQDENPLGACLGPLPWGLEKATSLMPQSAPVWCSAHPLTDVQY